MHIRTYNTVNEYWMDVGHFLLTNPVKYNIVLGQLVSTKDRDKILTNTSLLALFDNDQFIMTAFKNRPNVILYGENYTIAHLQNLSEYFKMQQIRLNGCIGDKNLAKQFSKIYNPEFKVDKTLIGHKLAKLKPIDLSEGCMETCDELDIELATIWLEKFGKECQMPHRPIGEAIKKMAMSLIENGRLFKWVVNNTPVSICTELVSNDYFSKISLVYTPVEQRNRGYALSCVWTLTKMIQDRGQKTICLFTDKSNPTSNKIYKQIGYEPMFEDYEISYQ
ncbi:MAG: hypothetical protein JNL75_06365 [Chitinophagales bacterium]|nr:hypothetical protein [Chitinophagales bacterium]